MLSAPLALLLASAVPFTDIAVESGLSFTHQNSPTEQKHLIETMPGGVAAFDYDGDGRIDIFFTNGAESPSLKKSDPKYRNRLFHNEGNSKFRDVTQQAGLAGEGYSMGVAAADFDNDGHPDLFVAGVSRNILYRNRGDGTFEDVTAKAGIHSELWSVAAGWFDYDNDGKLDLFVVNYAKWTASFSKFCGDEGRGIRVYCHPRFFEGLPNTLYRNRGDGTFEDVTKQTGLLQHIGRGMSVAFADYDGDGFTDAFVTNDKLPNFLFHNEGGKRFEEVALLAGVALPDHGKAISAMGADFRDIDNDGRPDIHLTALNGETFPLFRNAGDGQFTEITYPTRMGPLSIGASGWSNGIYDFDNDGRKDIFVAGSHVNDRIEAFEPSTYKQRNLLFWNTGRIFTVTPIGEPRAHRGSAVADFDGDGKLDIVVSSLGDRAELWHNTGASGNWLTIQLTGVRSNRDGIGAVVRAGAQTNHMTSAVGYASSSLSGVHFGLGEQTKVDLEIRWPSGIVQKLPGVKANQVVRVTEKAE